MPPTAAQVLPTSQLIHCGWEHAIKSESAANVEYTSAVKTNWAAQCLEFVCRVWSIVLAAAARLTDAQQCEPWQPIYNYHIMNLHTGTTDRLVGGYWFSPHQNCGAANLF